MGKDQATANNIAESRTNKKAQDQDKAAMRICGVEIDTLVLDWAITARRST